MFLLYFFIVLAATTLGAITGMGGGVIIKPVLDALGQYDAATIGLLSSITVFVMALVSVARQAVQGTPINPRFALPVGLGAVVGGHAGQWVFEALLTAQSTNPARVTIIQNVCLAMLIAAVFLYMLNKSRLPSLHLQGMFPAFLAGCLLGIFSSFLGIGGGPINVGLLVFLFSMDTKSAAVYSIVTILCAQASRLLVILVSGQLWGYDLSMLPAMAAAAVCGGFLGSWLNKRLLEKTVEKAFNGMQACIFMICIFNILKYL